MAESVPQSGQSRLFEWLFLIALFTVCVAIRSSNLSVLVAAPDELTYASRGILILGGNWAWPTLAMWDQPPLFEYMLALVTVVGGASLDPESFSAIIRSRERSAEVGR